MAADKASNCTAFPCRNPARKSGACSSPKFLISIRAQSLRCHRPGDQQSAIHVVLRRGAVVRPQVWRALVKPQTLAQDMHKPRVSAFSELSKRYGKITCNVMMSGWLQGPGVLDAEVDPHRCAVSFDGSMFSYGGGLASPRGSAGTRRTHVGSRFDLAAAPAAARMIADAPRVPADRARVEGHSGCLRHPDGARDARRFRGCRRCRRGAARFSARGQDRVARHRA